MEDHEGLGSDVILTTMVYGVRRANNMSEVCPTGRKPKSLDYLSGLNSGELTVTTVCCVVAIATLVLYIEEIYHFSKHLSRWRLRNIALVLLAIYPVTSFNAMISILVPRASGMSDLTVSTYYGICVFLFTQMLFHHFGGKKRMVEKVGSQCIQLRSPPCCCCLCCLPQPQVTLKRLNILEACVMQYVVIRPMIMYVAALLVIDAGADTVLDDQVNSNVFYQVLSLLNVTSTLLSVYANTVMFRLSNLQLSHVYIRPKFFLLQGCIALESLQRLLIALLVSVGAITCRLPLDVNATASRYHHQLLTIEMIFLAIAARVYYRKGAVDDSLGSLPQESEETPGQKSDEPSEDRNAAPVSQGNGDCAVSSGDAVVTSQNMINSNSHSGTHGALELTKIDSPDTDC